MWYIVSSGMFIVSYLVLELDVPWYLQHPISSSYSEITPTRERQLINCSAQVRSLPRNGQ